MHALNFRSWFIALAVALPMAASAPAFAASKADTRELVESRR